jgi:hypothetical protein
VHGLRPIHAVRDVNAIEQDLKPLRTIFRHRMLAAKMVMPFLQEAELDRLPRLPKE